MSHKIRCRAYIFFLGGGGGLFFLLMLVCFVVKHPSQQFFSNGRTEQPFPVAVFLLLLLVDVVDAIGFFLKLNWQIYYVNICFQ